MYTYIDINTCDATHDLTTATTTAVTRTYLKSFTNNLLHTSFICFHLYLIRLASISSKRLDVDFRYQFYQTLFAECFSLNYL